MGSAGELLQKITNNDLKGEITLVISNKSVDSNIDNNIDLVSEIKLLLNKMSAKDIAEYLAEKLKMSKKIIYQNILNIKK